ncbi:alpha/beta fold hydrolase [Synechococcus sp. CB0101]|uniref:alpha/beta fold hydrolase n=1 Tax=Synechococcus sp. CB0101 TaxID=232348 RepID=UPI003529FE05
MLGNRSDPALVLIHGFGAASGHWRHNAAELAAAGWCVYAIDLVGFGASSQPGHRRHRPLDNRLWARQLKGFLEQVVQGQRCWWAIPWAAWWRSRVRCFFRCG